MQLKTYNIRVYGLLINSANEVLLSQENRFGKSFTKFPGGGHELGEGIKDTVIREFKEELDLTIEVKQHFYTTDFFQVSAFNNQEQLISIYFIVESDQSESIENGKKGLDSDDQNQTFIWKKIDSLTIQDVTYPIDQLVVDQLKKLP